MAILTLKKCAIVLILQIGAINEIIFINILSIQFYFLFRILLRL